MTIAIVLPFNWSEADRQRLLGALALAADKFVESDPTSTMTEYLARSIRILYGWLKVCLLTKGVRPAFEFEERYAEEYLKTIHAALSMIQFEHENRGTVRPSLEYELEMLERLHYIAREAVFLAQK